MEARSDRGAAKCAEERQNDRDHEDEEEKLRDDDPASDREEQKQEHQEPEHVVTSSCCALPTQCAPFPKRPFRSGSSGYRDEVRSNPANESHKEEVMPVWGCILIVIGAALLSAQIVWQARARTR